MTLYMEKAQKILTKAKKMFEENPTEDSNIWEHVVTKSGTRLFKRESLSNDQTVPYYYMLTTINHPASKLVDRIWKINEEDAKKNDPTLTDLSVIERTDFHRVYSQYHAITWPVWPRHVVYAQYKFDEQGVQYIVSFSIDHPKVLLDDEQYVRGNIRMSVYEFKEIMVNGKSSTSAKRIAQIDPCGSIPSFIVNMFAENQVNVFNSWK